jgi:hypothetical protein
MKKILFSALALALGSLGLQAQTTAKVQVIHNCPDAQTVDVYVGSTLAIDNFQYRTASGYVDLPAGMDTIFIAPSNSTSKAGAIYNLPVTLVAGMDYVVIASGLVGTAPAGQAFRLSVNAGLAAGTAGDVKVLVYHGSHDAPTVDVRGVDTSTVIINDISFGAFSGSTYATFPSTADAILRVTTADGATVVASYTAPLSTLGGKTAVVFASGYLTPPMGGAAFGLFAAIDTNVVALPLVVVSVSQLAQQALGLRAYPNPTTQNVQLDFSLLSEQQVGFQIFDMQGRMLQNIAPATFNTGDNTQNIDLSNLNTGIYSLNIVTATGVQAVQLQVTK